MFISYSRKAIDSTAFAIRTGHNEFKFTLFEHFHSDAFKRGYGIQVFFLAESSAKSTSRLVPFVAMGYLLFH